MKELSYTKLINNIANFLQSYARGVSYAQSGLKVRTGRLRNSIFALPEYSRNRVLFGVGVVYGRIQELGGVITPKKAKRLWIPLKTNMTKAGVPRFLPRDVFEKGFVRGNFFFLKEGKRAIPMFVLKDKVEIQPKKYLRSAIEKLNNYFPMLVDRWIADVKIFEKILEKVRRGK